jgi:NAD-dependent DNA ligase
VSFSFRSLAVVAAADAGNKRDKAQELGIAILDEAALLKLLEPSK